MLRSLWLRKLSSGLFGRPSSSRKLRRQLRRTRLNLERLEDRTLLSAPDQVTISSLTSGNTDQFVGGSGTSSGTQFIGATFDNLSQTIGGISDGWGAQANLSLNGHAGIDASYSADGGSVNATYNKISLNQNYLEPTRFGEQVNFNPQNTQVSYGSGSFSTTSPSLGVGLSLDAQVSGSVGGSIAAFGATAGGSTSFSSANVNVPLMSIDPTNGLSIGGQSLSSLYNTSPGGGVNVSSGVLPAVTLQSQIPDTDASIAYTVTPNASLTGATESLDLIQGAKATVSYVPASLYGGLNLGTASQSQPNIALSSSSLQSGGVLSATGGSSYSTMSLQMGGLIAPLTLLPGEAGKAAKVVAGLFDTDSLGIGPFSLTVTPVSFTMGPDLSFNQSGTITPTNALTYNFSDASGNTLKVDVTKNGTDLGLVSSVTFTPGADNLGIKFTGAPITVTPTWTTGLNFTNEIDLDYGLKGTLTVGALSASASLGPLSADLTLGPLYQHTYNIANVKLATVFNKTFNIATHTEHLSSFVIGSSFPLSTEVTTTTDTDVGGKGSLRDAVDSADAQPSKPQIIHLGAGTYNLTAPLGPLDVSAQNLIIQGAGIGQTIINASGLGAGAFVVASGANLTLEGVTVEGGSGGTGNYDAGITNFGTATIRDSSISNNSLGGIDNRGSMSISDTDISHNTGGGGAGIFNEGTLTIANSTVSNNSVTGNSDVGGGGIVNTSKAALTIIDGTISNNSSSTHAGGIEAGGTITIINSTIYGNQAGSGFSGGGIDGGRTLTLYNTIVAGNSAGGSSDIHGAVSSNSAGNLIGDGTGLSGITNGTNSNQIGTQSQPIAPLLSPLGNYGGPTQTMALLLGSPAIDAGTTTVPGGLPLTDQRGLTRAINGHVDIGAVEYQYDLALTGNVANGSACGTVQYSYTVTNNGPDPVAGATLTVPLPQGATYQSLVAPTGWTKTVPSAGQNGTVTLKDTGILYSGQTASFIITVQLQNTTVGASLTNTATVGPATWDTHPENNSVTLTLTNEQEGQTFNNVPLYHFTDPNIPVLGTYGVSIDPFGDSKLAAGTYYYTVTSIVGGVESTPSNEVSMTVPISNQDFAGVHWNPIAGATAYKVYRGTSPGHEDTLVYTLTDIVDFGNSPGFTDDGTEKTSAATPPTNNKLFTAFVNWGDNSGNTSNDGTATVSVVSNPNGGFDIVGSHAYAEEGNYGATVVVTGMDGTAYNNGPEQNGTVNQAPFTNAILHPLANVLLYHFTAANNPNATAGDFTASVNWGDKTNNVSNDGTGDVSVVANPNGGFDVYGSHAYAVAASYGIAVTITDVNGAQVANGGLAFDSGLTPQTSFTNTVLYHFNDADVPNLSATNVLVSGGGLALDSYTYTVTSISQSGVESPPSNAVATVGSSDLDVKLTWNQVAGATGYRIYRTGQNIGNTDTRLIGTITNGSTVSFTDTGLEATSIASPPQFATTVNWGDNTSNTSNDGSGSVWVVANPNGGFDVIGSHAYQTSGSDGITVSVNIPAPTLYEGVQLVNVGYPPSVSNTLLYHFTETNPSANPNATASNFIAYVSWGDNGFNLSNDGTGNVSVVANPNGGFDVYGSHTYGWIGSYQAIVEVIGPGGVTQTNGSSNFNSGLSPQQLFVVGDAPLTAGALTPPPNATINQAIANFTNVTLFHFTDPGNQSATAGDFSASVNWGDTTSNSTSDGSGAVWVVADPTGGFDIVGSHPYAKLGNYAITVTVTGSDGTTYGRTQNFQYGTKLFHFTDTDPNGTASDYKAKVTWGDGNISSTDPSDTNIPVLGTYGVSIDPFGDSKLAAGTYYYTVTSIVGGVESTPSNEVSMTVPISNRDFAGVHWNPIAGATAYKVYRGTSPGQEDTLVYTLTDIVDFGNSPGFTDDGTEKTSAATPPTLSSVSVVANPNGGFDVYGLHTYTKILNPGTFSVQVSDAGGASTSASDNTFQVLYPDQPLTAGTLTLPSANGVTVNTEGQSISNQVLFHFTDPDAGAQASDFVADVSWGDATLSSSNDGSNSVWVVANNGGFDVVGSHTYVAGSYVFGVRVTDKGDARSTTQPDAGGLSISASSATLITITDPPVVVTAGPTFQATVNTMSAVQTLATFTDPVGPDSDPTAYVAMIQWGDGTLTEASLAGQVNYGQPSLSQSYVPVVNTPTVSGSGGALAAGTYYYTVTSKTATSESTPSSEVSATTTGGNAVMLTWGQVAGATGYKIYRGTTPGGETSLIATINSGSTVSFKDDGTEPTYGAPPQQFIGHKIASSASVPGIVLGSDGKTFSVNLAHQYAVEGFYTISTTINHNGHLSGPVTITTTAPTATSISAPTATYGNNASVTVTVSSTQGTPTGNISLTVGNGSPITQALVNGSATFTLSGLAAGTYNLSASYTAQGSFQASTATGSITVNPLAVTLTGNRTYDGTTTAAAGVLTASNLVSGDNLTLSGSATLASANVGSENITSFSGLTLGGSSAGNYTLTGATGSVTINPLAVTLTGSRIYDGTTTAAASILTVSDKVSGDNLTLSGSATLASAKAGTEQITSVVGLSLSGSSANNYTLTGAAGAVTITPLAVAVTGTRVYDGTTTAAASILSVSNLISGDNLTLSGSATLASANAGNENITSFAGLNLSGSSAGNYRLTGATGSVTITPLAVVLTGSRIYDGTTKAAASILTVSDLVSGDNLSLSGSATLASASAGSEKITSFAGLSLSGSSASNYTLSGAAGSVTITPLGVVLTGTRVYDGTTTAAASVLTVSNLVSGDNLTLSGSATLASANVGVESITSFAGLSLGGSAAGNYSLTGATGSVTITQAVTSFSNLTVQQITLGTSTTTVSGKLTSNTIVPSGQSVSITLNGVTQSATVGANGSFSTSFNTSALGIGTYSISYSYAGDNNFKAATGIGSLTVAYGSKLLFDNTKSVHSGAVLPIKLALTNASGANISSPNLAVTATNLVDANGNAVALKSPGNSNPNNLFRYDASLGGYIFNLDTKGLATGTYTFYYTVGNDPIKHSLTFVVG